MKMSRLLALIVVCLSAWFVVAAAAQEADSEFESPDSIQQREEWYHHQRAYPLKHIPAGMRLKALRARQLMEAQARAQATVRPSVTSAWTLVGPEPTIPLLSEAFAGSPNVSGRVTALAVDPTNASIIYAGGADGGVWKTTNGGTNWTPLTDTQVSLAIGAFAIDPSNHLNIYAGTGEDNNNQDGYTGAGILKSTDGGSTWTNLPGPFVGPFDSVTGGGSIGSLAVHPTNGQILLAGVTLEGADGVYRSTDGGSTWTGVIGGSGFPATAVVFDPTNGNNAFVAIGASGGNAQNGIYGSTDAGATWTPLLTAGTAPAGRIALALAPSTPTTLYASIAYESDGTTSAGSLYALYKTTNSGTSWTKLASVPNYCNPQCWYDMALAVAPNNANVVFGAGAYQYATDSQTTVVRSTDGGTTWALLGGGANGVNVHTDGHAVAFSPSGSTVYVGTDGGVWSSTNVTASTVNWTSLNATLAITQFYNGLSVDPTNVNRMFGGAQDNGPQGYTDSLTWNGVAPCGDGGFSAIDPLSPDTVYVSGHGPCVEKSTTGGSLNTFSNVAPTISSSGRIAFIPPVVLDPSSPSNVYVGANQLYQSTDGATTWNAISPDLTAGGTLAIVAVAPSDSNTIYTGSDDAIVAVTKDALAGTSSKWSNISTAATRAVTDIKVDPTTSTTAYVTYGGFSGFTDSVGHVFKTTNGGSSWTDISGNLPNTEVTSIAIDPDVANTYYVGTDVGAFSTSNGGTTWSVLGTGLPNVGVVSLAFQHATRTLVAGTHGRSAWTLNLSTAESLSVTLAGTGSGSVSSSPSGIGCPSTCSANFASGTVVTLTAKATAGSTFAGWTGACSGTGSCSVTMSAAKSVTATFNTTVTTFALSVTLAGTGSGTITSSPTGISCPSTCSANFNSGTVVTLTQVAGSGSTFAGWGGACSGTGSCSVTMSAAKTVTATFNTTVTTFALSVTLAGTGSGTITSSPSGITCPSTCSHDFNSGTVVTLTEVAGSGSTFAGWGGACSGTGTCSVTMSAAKSVTATFNSSSGPAVTLTPTSLNFGTVATGVLSPLKTVTLKNSGKATLTGISIAMTGTNISDFPETTTCTSSLVAGASCLIKVQFKPAAAGARSAAVSITDNAAGSPQQVPLSGTGTTAKLSPTSLAFGTWAVGLTSTVDKVTLTNVGTAALTITSIAVTGTEAGDFPETATTCGASLAAAASCTISVTFKPSTTGTRSANLTFTDSASGSPQQAPLSGTGTTAEITPRNLNFGTLALGLTSAAKTVTLKNVGTSAITITSIAITGTEAGDFPQTATTCGASLAVAASCTVSVTFKPSTTGARSGTLTFTDGASGSPQKVPLSGVGTTAELSPTSLNFGSVTVGSTALNTVTLKNVGTAAMTISGITISGAAAGDFGESGCGSSLAAGASCTISVTFKPTKTGARSATLKITDGAAGSPQQVSLAGTGS
jgi:photosystem II stability/assembly factor-like uncharacterized protein